MIKATERIGQNNQRDVRETQHLGAGPVVEDTPWGYIIRQNTVDHALNGIGSLAGRFFGVLLLLAAAGLWLLPHALLAAELFAIKLGMTTMLGVFGGLMLWAGRSPRQPEFRIDTAHREVRIGHSGPGSCFTPTARVDFEEIGAVFLLRSKSNRPTRLFLRLTDFQTGIEIASGNAARMEALKERVSCDLNPNLAKAARAVTRQAPARRPRADRRQMAA